MKKIVIESKSLGKIEIIISEDILINEDDKSSQVDISQVKKLFDTAFKEKSKDIENTIIKLVKQELSGKATENKMVEIARNCIIQLFKTLWVRRASWTNGIKNERA